jgi:hypothetical protein
LGASSCRDVRQLAVQVVLPSVARHRVGWLRSPFSGPLGQAGLDAREFDVDAEFEQPENPIQYRIIAAVFDQRAGMGSRGAIAAVEAAGIGVVQAAADMRQVHCKLARIDAASATSAGLDLQSAIKAGGQLWRQICPEPDYDEPFKGLPQSQSTDRIAPARP